MEKKTLTRKIMDKLYEANVDYDCSGTQTEHKKDLTIYYTYQEEEELLKGIVKEIGKELLQWLYDNGYLASRNIAGTMSWERILEEFSLDVGLIKTCKCRACKGTAIQLEGGKFHCVDCGHMFEERICPNCGKKLDGPVKAPKDEPQFTPYLMCSCGYQTEASSYK